MARLQLYIAKSARGYKSLMNINPDEDVRRYIADCRQALESARYDSTRVNIFHLLAYRSRGVMVSVLRTIPDVPGDHVAATVFVPDSTDIAPAALLAVLGELASILKSPQVTSSQAARLREIFDKDYPTLPDPPLKAGSEGRHYCCARVGNAPGHCPTLTDYAATRFYTPAFADNSGVLLLPPGIECGLEDITVCPLPRLMALNPPPPSGHGFVPHIYRRVFNVPYLVPQGAEVEIEWKRSGFDTLSQTIVADSPDAANAAPEAADARKILSPGTFYVTSASTREPISAAVVRVNGCEINRPVSFTFAELERATVEVSAPGYFNYSGKLDLASTTQALVQMKELRKTYRFDLPVITPDPEECVHFTIESKRPLSGCPVEGYEIAGEAGLKEGITKVNTLRYIGKAGRRTIYYIIAAAVGGLIAGALLGALLAAGGSAEEEAEEPAVEVVETLDEEPVVTEQVVVPPSGRAEAAADTTRAAAPDTAPASPAPQAANAAEHPGQQAVEYLDSHKTWDRAEMEPLGIAGLFDDMNTYNFEHIKTYWAPRLQASQRFGELLGSVHGSASKRDPRTGTHTPTFNREGNTRIGVWAYRCHIDP